MKSKKQIKARIREVESNISFEKGRLSVIDEQQQDVEASKGIRSTIRQMEAVVETLKDVLA